MGERKLEIPGADGMVEAFLYTPSGLDLTGGSAAGGPWPGVLFFTDIFGIRPANQGMAQRVADAGYAVLMPNIFYRSDKLPIIDFEFKMGDPRSMQMLQHLKDALGNDQMKRDAAAFADALLTQDEVTGLKVAAVGYCFSGKMALFATAEVPDKVAAAASFHGGGLVSDAPDSPHTVLPRVKGELYFGHATQDQSMTPAQIEKLDDALKEWGGVYQSEVYEGARHGWTVPGRDVYDEKQAERHYAKLFDLLKRTLG